MKLKDLKNCLKSQSIGQSEIRNGHKNSYYFYQRSGPSYTHLLPLGTSYTPLHPLGTSYTPLDPLGTFYTSLLQLSKTTNGYVKGKKLYLLRFEISVRKKIARLPPQFTSLLSVMIKYRLDFMELYQYP